MCRLFYTWLSSNVIENIAPPLVLNAPKCFLPDLFVIIFFIFYFFSSGGKKKMVSTVGYGTGFPQFFLLPCS